MGEVLDLSERITKIREAAEWAIMLEGLLESGEVIRRVNEEGISELYAA